MIDRRGFLGSVIGMVAAYQFRAILPSEPIQMLSKVTPFRMLFRDILTGFTIQAPGIQHFYKEGNSFNFVTESLNVLKTMRLNQVILLNSKGKVIMPSDFSTQILVCNGDTLCVTQTLCPDRNMSEGGFLDYCEKGNINVCKSQI